MKSLEKNLNDGNEGGSSIAIIGYGHVGKAMHQLFKDAIIYDKLLNIGSMDEANNCDVGFVCVPTPQLPNGHCDVSVVKEVLNWLETKVIVIRSTVYIGFTDEMLLKTKKRIVFQPEYYGETHDHPFANLSSRNWLSFGGNKDDINLVLKAYKKVYTAEVQILTASPRAVELAKYMENAFLALKVTFCNEIYDIAEKFDIDYNEAREIWLADPRIGRSHTFVYEDNRGYGGACLPKDVSSLISQSKDNDVDVTLLDAVVEKNKILKKTKIGRRDTE